MDFFSLCVLNFHYLTLTEMHLCLVKLSPTLELSMQAFFGVKLVYKYDKYKVATLFFNIGEKKNPANFSCTYISGCSYPISGH